MTDKEKLIKIKKLADAMYFTAFNMTTDASLLRKAMNEYHQFIIHEDCKEEPVSKVWHDARETPELDKTILLIALNGNSSLALWDGKALKSCTLGGGHSVLCSNDKWAYIDELLKL